MTAPAANGARRAAEPRHPESDHEPTHGDLLRKATKDAVEAKERTDQLHHVVQRVEGKLDKLLRAIGDEGEDEHGARIGTGLTGRLMRLEVSVRRRFHLYDRWTWIATGVVTTAGVAAAIIWWLVENRVAFLR